jgi:hypothetical protein
MLANRDPHSSANEEADMSDAPKPLDLDHARAALARARNDITPAAVRAPRPADLSRLQEMEARTATIDARASAFRETVRQSLGLGAYNGPAVAPSRLAAHAMSTPLCDADVCAPVRPVAATSAPVAAAPELAQAQPAGPAPVPAEALTEAPMEAEGPGAAVGPDLSDTGDEPGPSDIIGESARPPKRKKFLGIF